MERQNVTISLPKVLLKKAKAIAALREKSLSELLRESLEEKVRESTGYKRARTRQVGLLQKGLNLGTNGSISVSREELHER
jgi:metal-responsive CopG/Arc/MetJ family transcriptional regulator